MTNAADALKSKFPRSPLPPGHNADRFPFARLPTAVILGPATMHGELCQQCHSENPTPRIALFVRPSVRPSQKKITSYIANAHTMRGSHGLSARRAPRTKSSRPEGPQTRSWDPEGP